MPGTMRKAIDALDLARFNVKRRRGTCPDHQRCCKVCARATTGGLGMLLTRGSSSEERTNAS